MSRQAYSLNTLIGIFLLLLTACSSPQKQRLPALLQQGQHHNLAGVAAEEKGKFLVAESEFNEAYRLFASVENYQWMATVLINSSRLYRRIGELDKADKVLKQSADIITNFPELETEFYFEKCKVEMLKGDNDKALFWAEKGVKSAKDPDRARMFNLAALVYLKKGEYEKCREIAGSARSYSLSFNDKYEEANALRLLGEVAVAESQFKEALDLYGAALLIDRVLAIPWKVSADLYALSIAAEALGDIKQSAEYLQRAVDSEIADRNVKAAAGKLDRLVKLYQQSGNSQAADNTIKLKNQFHGAYPRSSK